MRCFLNRVRKYLEADKDYESKVILQSFDYRMSELGINICVCKNREDYTKVGVKSQKLLM